MSTLSFHHLHRGKKPGTFIYHYEMTDKHITTPYYMWEDQVVIPNWVKGVLLDSWNSIGSLNLHKVQARAFFTRKGNVQYVTDFSFSIDNVDYYQYTIMGGHTLYVQHNKGLDVIREGFPKVSLIIPATQFCKYLRHIVKFVQKYYPARI